jgi:hypothetical protein
VPRAAIAALIHIHFEDLVDLVDRRWAEGLDLSRTVFEEPDDRDCLLAEVPARKGRPRALLIRVAEEGERWDQTEGLLLDSYLDHFLAGRTPERILGVRASSAPSAVRRRWIVDPGEGGEGLYALRLPYLAVELDARPPDRRTAHELTSHERAGNLRPFHTPFRREPPCNSVSSVYPSRERRRCSTP